MPRRPSPQSQSYRHSDAIAAAEAEALAHMRLSPRQRQVVILRAALESVRHTLTTGGHGLRLADDLGCGEEVRAELGWIERAISALSEPNHGQMAPAPPA